MEKVKNKGYSLGIDPDIDDVLYETNRIHLKLVIMVYGGRKYDFNFKKTAK